MNIKKGNPLQKGSTKQKDGYNFAIASAAEIIAMRRTGRKSLIRMQRRLQAVKFLAKMKTSSI